VECKGVFHCPNDLCLGSGAAYFRSTLQSYKDLGREHTVDEGEWFWRARKNMKENKPEIWEYVKSSGHLEKFVNEMDMKDEK
jgi:hypothetical protein